MRSSRPSQVGAVSALGSGDSACNYGCARCVTWRHTRHMRHRRNTPIPPATTAPQHDEPKGPLNPPVRTEPEPPPHWIACAPVRLKASSQPPQAATSPRPPAGRPLAVRRQRLEPGAGLQTAPSEPFAVQRRRLSPFLHTPAGPMPGLWPARCRNCPAAQRCRSAPRSFPWVWPAVVCGTTQSQC